MPLIKTNTNQKEQVYLVRLQPKRLKTIHEGNKKRAPVNGLKKGITLRVKATSDKDAQRLALKRKRNPLTKYCGYIVRWSRPFYA